MTTAVDVTARSSDAAGTQIIVHKGRADVVLGSQTSLATLGAELADLAGDSARWAVLVRFLLRERSSAQPIGSRLLRSVGRQAADLEPLSYGWLSGPSRELLRRIATFAE
jgi:hypothetical protein